MELEERDALWSSKFFKAASFSVIQFLKSFKIQESRRPLTRFNLRDQGHVHVVLGMFSSNLSSIPYLLATRLKLKKKKKKQKLRKKTIHWNQPFVRKGSRANDEQGLCTPRDPLSYLGNFLKGVEL